jgi:hypothetical protein
MVMSSLLTRKYRSRQRGSLSFELVAAMSLLLLAALPLGYSFLHDQQLCRIYYIHAVATEIIDGEMEVLAAGEWRHFAEGTHAYQVSAKSAQNLPPGRFLLTRNPGRLLLEWLPDKRNHGGRVIRELALP